MLESQVELRAENSRNAGIYKRLVPGLAEPFSALNREVYKDGAISGKHKRLMALVGALCSGCRACILFQCDQALEKGATVDEIFEACSVTLALRGSMGMGETERVVAYLRERGLIAE